MVYSSLLIYCLERVKRMIINKEKHGDVLTMWLLIDKYYVYQVKFKWHDGAEDWVIKSLEMIAVLDHHIPYNKDK